MSTSSTESVPGGTAMTIAETAAHWWIRQDTGTLTTREQRAFEAWRGAAEAHRQAYEDVRLMWGGFEDEADSPELRALRTAARAVQRQPKRWPWVVAATLLCAVGMISAVAIKLHPSGQPVSADRINSDSATMGEAHTTSGNERSTITLSDGSVVTLNRDTTMVVTFTESERKVRITRGQAFFEVAKNPRRPFVVSAADRSVTALGTQFDVRLDPDRVEVILVEGKVAVDHTDPSMLERLRLRKAHLELRPGEKLVAALGEPVAISNIDARRSTTWRQGWVTVENETVFEAVAELNRYSDRQITVPDESVRNLRLSGVFRVGQPDRFAAAIQELLPVKVVEDDRGELVLLRAQPDEKPVR